MGAVYDDRGLADPHRPDELCAPRPVIPPTSADREWMTEQVAILHALIKALAPRPSQFRGMVPTENNLRGLPDPQPGDLALTEDQQKAYLFTRVGWMPVAGTGGGGTGGGIQVVATEALLRATPGTTGDVAFTLDTSTLWQWDMAAASWRRIPLGGATVTSTSTAGATPASWAWATTSRRAGDVFTNLRDKAAWVHDGTSWLPLPGVQDWDTAATYAAGDLVVHNGQMWSAAAAVPAGVEPVYGEARWRVLQREVLHIQTSGTGINPPVAIPGDFYFDTDTKDFGYLSPWQPDPNDRTLVLFGGPPPATIHDLASLRQDPTHGTAAMAGTPAFTPDQYITIGVAHMTWDGTNWVMYGGKVQPAGLHRNSGLNENQIRQWIAESSRFRGALRDDGSTLVGAVEMHRLPAAAQQNQAQYWVASEEIPNPIPGDKAYHNRIGGFARDFPPTEAQIQALTSIAALEALVPAADVLAAGGQWAQDWRAHGWLLEMGGIKAIFDGTAWQEIVTLDTLKSGDWLQSVGDPAQGVRGFVRIPGGTLTISLADAMYVRQDSDQALPHATKNDQRLRSRIGAQPVWEDIPPAADQAIKRVLVNTKTANNEVAWSGLWPTHAIHPTVDVYGDWHYRPAQAPFQLGEYRLIGPAATPAAQGDLALGADLKAHYRDLSGTDRHIVWEAMITGNIITVQGVDSSRTMSFQINGAPTRTGDVVTIPGTLTGNGAADPGSYVVNAINPGPPPDDGALQVIGPMLRVTTQDVDGWMGAQIGQQPPMPGPGSMMKVRDSGIPDLYSVFEVQSVKAHGDYLDIIVSPSVRPGPRGHFSHIDGRSLQLGVDNSPVPTVVDVRPGEYLLVGDPGRMPTGSGPDQGKQVTAGDLVQALDRDGDGNIDGYRILTGETPTSDITMVGVIDDVGTESHTWTWDEVGIPMGYSPPTTNTHTGADVGQFNFVNTAPTSPANSAHWDKTAKTVAFWETAADTNTDIRQLPGLFKAGNTVLYVGGRNPGSSHTFLLTSVTYANSIVTCTYIGEPGGGATADPGGLEHVAWTVTNGKVADFPPNSYLMVDAVPTDKKVPAGVPGARGRTVGIGDWLVAVDTDGDGLSDVWHLLHHQASLSSSTFHLVATAAANHTTTWALADIADDTKVPVGSWVIVSDDVNEMAPAGMSWLDVNGSEYVAGAVHPPRGSLAQKTATNHLVERWAPDEPWRLHVTAPPGQPFHSSYAWFNSRQWDWFKVGVPAIVAEVNAQGRIPAMSKFPSLTAEQPAAPGDWLVPMDLNNDGITDDVVLVRQLDGVVLVANEAARLALTNIPDGTLVVQQDTGWTWRYQAAYVGHAFYSPWRVFSDYVGADTIAARDALAPHIHIGTLVSVGKRMFQYKANPNTAAGQPPGVFLPFGDHYFAHKPAEGASPIWFDRGLTNLGLTGIANDAPVRNNTAVDGEWVAYITGQTRAECDLYLLLHTGTWGVAPADAPTQPVGGKDAFGPWHVKADRAFVITVRGAVDHYGFWDITFAGQNPDGQRIHDHIGILNAINARDLPAFGVATSTGNIYARARFEMLAE